MREEDFDRRRGRLAAGKGPGVLTFRLPDWARLSRTGDGFVSLGITCLSYGLTELVHGYGFLAVFVTALTLRHEERTDEYHEKVHEFSEQLERLMMMVGPGPVRHRAGRRAAQCADLERCPRHACSSCW